MQKAPKHQRDKLGHAGAARSALPLRAGERESGSRLSVHPSLFQPWLSQPRLKRGFSSPVPLFFPSRPKAGTAKGDPVLEQRKRLCRRFGNARELRESEKRRFAGFRNWKMSVDGYVHKIFNYSMSIMPLPEHR